jgi:hypothetical protein
VTRVTAQPRDEAAAAPGLQRPARVPAVIGALIAFVAAGCLLALPASTASSPSSERRTVAGEMSGALRGAVVALDVSARGAMRAAVPGDADLLDAQRSLWALAAALTALLPARAAVLALSARRTSRRTRCIGSRPGRAPPAPAAP